MTMSDLELTRIERSPSPENNNSEPTIDNFVTDADSSIGIEVSDLFLDITSHYVIGFILVLIPISLSQLNQ